MYMAEVYVSRMVRDFDGTVGPIRVTASAAAKCPRFTMLAIRARAP